MKIALSFIITFLFTLTPCAQSQTISAAEYEKAFQFAVTKTNEDYPLIFKVTTRFIENGKTVRTETEVNENEADGRYRIRRSVLANGRETINYQLTVGFGNVFCSDDAINWKPSKYECPAETMIYGNRNAESIEYSVTGKLVDGKQVKVYRKYSVFAPSENIKQKSYDEEIATIDSRGYFITVVNTEGKLDPQTVTLIREQSWTTQAKIKPVVAPK